MLLLIKLSPEITMKSRVVRRRLTRQLRKNLFRVLKEFDEKIEVLRKWDSLEINTQSFDDNLNSRVRDRLQSTPGVGQICLVEKHKLASMDLMLELIRKSYSGLLKRKSFAVRCKRTGHHSFSSVDIERFIGHGLLQSCSPKGVDLESPEVVVALEIRDDDFYIVNTKLKGLGGLPLGCQDAVLSLISGGFDSSVSTYLGIKRGLQAHYCFFSLGGSSHELAVKEIALFLWMKFHSSHRVKFISVPFELVIKEIVNNVEDSQMGIVLKRMMIRAGDLIAKKLELNALITGESIAQVSSQTLANLAVIDDVSDSLILRPLCTSDKQEIINIAREIGTEDLSKDIPEYCAAISKKPTTKTNRIRIEREEARFDEKVLKEAVDKAKYQIISELHKDLSVKKADVEIVRNVKEGSMIIDIRHPNEREVSPLELGGNVTIINIPFYSLSSKFQSLTRSQNYLLYCDRGMMSRLQAANIIEQGFDNVSVLDLKVAE